MLIYKTNRIAIDAEPSVYRYYTEKDTWQMTSWLLWEIRLKFYVQCNWELKTFWLWVQVVDYAMKRWEEPKEHDQSNKIPLPAGDEFWIEDMNVAYAVEEIIKWLGYWPKKISIYHSLQEIAKNFFFDKSSMNPFNLQYEEPQD